MAVTVPVRKLGTASEAGDELLDPLVPRFERVLAQHRPLGLVVELEMDPVDGEVAPPLLGLADELAAQPRPSGLRRLVDRLLDGLVGAGSLDQPARLHAVGQAPL